MKLTIGRKLALAFVIVLSFMAFVAASAVISLNRARVDTQALIESQEALVAIDSVIEKLFEERIALETFIFKGEEEGRAEFEQARKEYDASWSTVKNHHSDRFPELINQVEQRRLVIDSVLKNMLLKAEISQGDFWLVELTDRYYEETLKPVIRTLREQELALAQEIAASARRLSGIMLAAASIVSGLAIVISIRASYAISRGISRAVVHLSDAADSISRGDLDVHIGVETGDEMQTLAESIERMRVSLKAAIERLRSR